LLETYIDLMNTTFVAYEYIVKSGIPKEDASMVLPLGMKTKFVVKMNVRALLNMAQVRMCTRAYHEYRKLMNEIKETLSSISDEWKEIADMMQPKCEVVGYCTEKHSCGRRGKKNELPNAR
jgi:thymidylate synthase (FAD)